VACSGTALAFFCTFWVFSSWSISKNKLFTYPHTQPSK
jgi:hypothetical protein